MDELYSGEETTKASHASSRRCSISAPGGKPSSRWTSASYDGASNSRIEARSTSPPFASIDSAARRASCVFSESVRSDAEKTRYRTARVTRGRSWEAARQRSLGRYSQSARRAGRPGTFDVRALVVSLLLENP